MKPKGYRDANSVVTIAPVEVTELEVSNSYTTSRIIHILDLFM